MHEAPEGSLVRKQRRAVITAMSMERTGFETRNGHHIFCSEKSGKKLPLCSNESSEDGEVVGEVVGEPGSSKWLLRSDCKALTLGLGRENLPPLENVLPLTGTAGLCGSAGTGTAGGGRG